jgi:hypothetical protein
MAILKKWQAGSIVLELWHCECWFNIKLRLQQAISEQSVIIVTRLLHCSRRNQRKEKCK